MSDAVVNQTDNVTGTTDKVITTNPAMLHLVSAFTEDAIIKDKNGVTVWKQPAESVSDHLNISLAGITIASDGDTGEVFIGFVAS